MAGKYNPRKAAERAARLTDKCTSNTVARVIAQVNTMTPGRQSGLMMTREQIETHSIGMLAALDQLTQRWDSFAFRCLSSWYRIAYYTAHNLSRSDLDKLACGARCALFDLSNDGMQPVMRPNQYRILRGMVLALINALPFVPAKLMDIMQQQSREQFERDVAPEWYGAPAWARDAVVKVINGASIDAAMQQHDLGNREAREQVITLGMAAHAMLHDSTTPIPETLQALRRLRRQLLPVIERFNRGDYLPEPLRAAA